MNEYDELVNNQHGETDFDEIFHKHYIYVVSRNNFIAEGFSDAFKTPNDNDILINPQGGRHFRLHPNGEINPPLRNDEGIHLYTWDASKATNDEPWLGIIPRTPEEIARDSLPDIETVRAAKMLEINETTRFIITQGLDIETSEGLFTFRLYEHDQINLLGLSVDLAAALAGKPALTNPAEGVWYSADKQPHRHWSVADFTTITNELTMHKMTQLTYGGKLKAMVRSAKSIKEIESIFYGMEVL